jgi:hypothetical protein
MDALELRDEVARRESERALAISAGVASTHVYVADLEEELEVCRSALSSWPYP